MPHTMYMCAHIQIYMCRERERCKHDTFILVDSGLFWLCDCSSFDGVWGALFRYLNPYARSPKPANPKRIFRVLHALAALVSKT